MRQTLIITKNQECQLEQILKELIFSLKKTISEEDLFSLSYLIIKESGRQTYNSKKSTAVNLFKSIGKFSGNVFKSTKSKIKSYEKNGISNEFSKDLNLTFRYLEKSPSKLKMVSKKIKTKVIDLNDNFIKKTRDEKIEIISVGIMTVLIFFAVAGGEDLEGGIPDSDLNLGVGFHRHFFSHSIIMGFVIEFLMRSGIEILNKSYKNLPVKHHSFWDKSNSYINKHKSVAIGSMWAGISAHLLKDSGIFGQGVKPYVGIPFKMSINAHQGLFVANGTASAIFAYQDIKK
jgi:hypothetical protein